MSTLRTVAVLVMKATGAIDMKLTLTPVCSSHFTHVVAKKILVTEMSDLGRNFVVEQLYDDACDVGLALRNKRTGNTTTWHITHDVYDEDGDLMHLELRPTHESVASNPAIRDYKMLLLND